MSWRITPSFTQWTPALLSTALWLDAADASTVTADGSNLVSQINDKSGNARHFTATTTARPTYTSSGQNGRNVLTFNGSSNALSRAVYTYGTTHSLFVAFKYTASASITPSTAGFSLLGDGNNNQLYAGPYSGTISNERIGYYSFTNGFYKNNADLNTSIPLIFSFSINNSYSSFIGRINAVADFASTQGAVIPNALSRLGSYNASSDFFTGQIYEILLTTSYLPVSDIEKTEGYLAHKWGLTANLPADHPYKVNPPAP